MVMVQSIQDIMTTEVMTVGINEDICTVAEIMKDNNVGVIPVVDEQNYCIGLVTDRDIVIRGLADRKSASLRVKDVLSNKIISIKPDTDIKEVADLMAKEQIRRLPVLKDGKLVGIVSMADLATQKSTKDEAGHAIAGVSKSTDKHSQ
jgi:CBS domain-containing protein